MQTSQQVAILGAGIGGLASGHFLREAGRDLAIYERAPVPGLQHRIGDETRTVVRSARSAADEILACPIPSEGR